MRSRPRTRSNGTGCAATPAIPENERADALANRGIDELGRPALQLVSFRPVRQIVLDTETTGLEVSDGHRIIEIGCIELVHRRPTGRTGIATCSPDREVEPGALAVHGITNEFLESQPAFADVAAEFLAFVDGRRARDPQRGVRRRLPRRGARRSPAARRASPTTAACSTRSRSRDACIPGQRNNLDALCKRYGVDNSGRDLHGALLDARILADVYLAMSGGQAALGLDAGASGDGRDSRGRAGRARRGPHPGHPRRARPSWPRTSARSRRSTGPPTAAPSSAPETPVARKRVPELSLRNCRIGVIGLGYVGLPLAVEFGKHYETIGFDINPERIAELRRGKDRTLEADARELRAAKRLRFTAELQGPEGLPRLHRDGADADRRRQAAGPRRRSSARARPSAGC